MVMGYRVRVQTGKWSHPKLGLPLLGLLIKRGFDYCGVSIVA